MTTQTANTPAEGRDLGWPAFLAVVVGYLVIIQVGGLLVGIDRGGYKSEFPTAEFVFRNALIPIGASVLYTAAVVTWLGWWGAIWRTEPHPARHWVRRVPLVMVVTAVLAFNYAHFADQTASLILTLVLLGVFVGVGEELMFRGIGVNVFRRAGLTEGKVALWSSLIFGLVHVTNAIGAGPQALFQAAVVSFSGYFFYLAYRSFGLLLVPMFVHGLWDFSLFSTSSGPTDPKAYVGSFLVIVVQLGLTIVALRQRSRVEAVPNAA